MALMKFDHVPAATLEGAASVVLGHGAGAVLKAGGTDLLGILKDGVHREHPGIVVDIMGIPGLDAIRTRGRGLAIGSTVRLDALARAPAVLDRYPILAEAARSVASPQIRNMATLGGNICQEPRCWYYRCPDDAFHCLRKGGTRCAAVAGDNRYHSIFGAARVASPPCSAGCPAHVDIPAYMGLVRKGDIPGAARIVLEHNPMPAITGRVCPHRCERECNQREAGEAVSIREVERFLGDWILEQGDGLAMPRGRRSGRSVAVVGAGPAGLSAAFYLRTSGHDVVVIDRMPEAGGMLAWSIPASRLPADVVRRHVRMLERMGIRFELGVEIGAGRKLAALRREHDAVFLATGAWRQRGLGIAGEELLGSGLDLLVGARRGERRAPGRKVLVIGGGNVAVDVAITALELGAREVTMACLESRDEMPAFPEEVEHAMREGVRIMTSWGPLAVAEKGGRVAGMDLQRCISVFDARGRFRPVLDDRVRRRVRADRVLLAIGQAPDLACAGAALKGDGGRIAAGAETMATRLRGVYAGGDAVTGPASIVEAVAAGRRAARSIDSFLTGKASSIPAVGSGPPGDLIEVNSAAVGRTRRAAAPVIDLDAFESEAHRCINCGCVAVSSSDLAPALIALGARVRTSLRTIPAEEFFAARPGRTTVLGPGEIVTGVDVPAQPATVRQSYLKFRMRSSIDFPIVGVATAVDVRRGRVARARIVLGAVAPVPVRARGAEEWLVGRRLDRAAAETAASLAVSAAVPLARNGYKRQIVRTLVLRSLMKDPA